MQRIYTEKSKTEWSEGEIAFKNVNLCFYDVGASFLFQSQNVQLFATNNKRMNCTMDYTQKHTFFGSVWALSDAQNSLFDAHDALEI